MSDVFVDGVVKGFVRGFKNLISPINQTQRQQTMVNPVQTQQQPSGATEPASDVGALAIASPITVIPSAAQNQSPPGASQHPSNLPSPTNGDTPDQNNNQCLTSQPLFQSTSTGSSVPQILNNTNPVTKPNTVWIVMNPSPHSAESLDHTSEPDDSNAEAILGQSSYQDRAPSENGDGGDRGDEVLVGGMDVQSINSYVYPPSTPASESIGTCRLNGCSNSTFVDPITDLESEYCSRKHHE